MLLALPATASADGPKDQVVLTGNVVVGPNETAGTIVVFDGPVTIRGLVTGDVVAFHGPVRVLGGRVNGDITTATDTIVVGPRGFVGGDLQYGDERPVIAPGARIGGELKKFSFSTDASPFSGFIFTLLWWIALTVSSLLLGLVLVGLWPRAVDAASAAWSRSPGPAIGWGALIFFGLPIAAVVLLVTLVGIPLGVGLLLALAPLYAVGYVAAAYVLGRMLIKPPGNRIVAFLVGLAILQVIYLVPILGPLVAIVATVIGLGALLVAGWRANHAQAQPVAPA